MVNTTSRIVIAGAGPVGACAALALAARGRAVTLLEARAAHAAPADPRTLALSHGSRMLLERLGAWRHLERVTPIERIHVSQRGGFGRVVLGAREAGVPALGYVVGYSALAPALRQALRSSAVDLLAGARLCALHSEPERVRMDIEQDGAQRTLEAQLLVLADGGQTPPAAAGIVERDYRQHALLAQVRAHIAQPATAYERFTAGGPLALLPYGDAHALIWTTSPERAQALCACSDAEFAAALHEEFGDRLGRLEPVSARASLPLTLRYARRTAGNRIVLIGNAAQTLHPVAGQGLNLGLRDAWTLAHALGAAPGDPGDERVLQQYRRRREADRRGGILFTDALVRVFSNDSTLLRAARGVGLAALDCLPPAKHLLAKSQLLGFGVALGAW